jgi:hypothetical protein
MIRLAVRLVVLVLIVLGVAEVAAHFLVQSEIAAAVTKRDPTARDVSASVPIPLLPSLLTTHTLSKVSVSARQVNLGSLTADRVTAIATGVHINVPSSFATRRAQVNRIDRIDLTATFTQGEASALLPPGIKFVFGKDTVTVQGLATSITGRFRLEPPARIVFTIVGSSIPGLSSLPAISFPTQPLASCLQSVSLAPGTLTVTCAETNPSTDFLPHR